MIRLHTEKGEISISDAALSNITGAAATSCFGVKGMAFRSMTDGLVQDRKSTRLNSSHPK